MTNKSTKRRNAVIAAIAGASLLVGGSTYALWSSQGFVEGGTITAGNLAIIGGVADIWDVSSDRSDQNAPIQTRGSTENGLPSVTITDDRGYPMMAHGIASDGWRMVPGDTVAFTFPYKVTLEGDNLVASLTMPGKDGIIDQLSFTSTDVDGSGVPNLKFEYQLFQTDGGTSLISTPDNENGRTALPDGDSFLVSYFQASSSGQANGSNEGATEEKPLGTMPMIGVSQDGDSSAVITFVLYVTFNSDVKGTTDVKAVLKLHEKITATLQQVRCDGENNPSGGNFICQ